MRVTHLGVVALVASLAGCASSTPAQFHAISWDGDQTFEPGAVQWNGTGEAIFRIDATCDGIYAWWSTDEGTQGGLTATLTAPDGSIAVEETFGTENREHSFEGNGVWKLTIHSHADFVGNGVAFLECL